jgi:beta-phosphoglucomutase
MYEAAIRRLGLAAHDCMIVEDNEHGIRAARASGAHVHVVSAVADVTHANLLAAIGRFDAGRGQDRRS